MNHGCSGCSSGLRTSTSSVRPSRHKRHGVIQEGDNSFYNLKSQIWVPIANALIASHIVEPTPKNEDPRTWVPGQLWKYLAGPDQEEVDNLNAQLASASQQDKALI